MGMGWVLGRPIRGAVVLTAAITVAITVAAAMVGVVAQQAARRTAEDVPRALLASVQSRLSAGGSVADAASGWPADLVTSDVPFVAVYDAQHHLLASNARIAGSPLNIPVGVLDRALQRGEDAVTWQPDAGIREATVAQPWTSPAGHGVLVAGASLTAVEARTAALRNWILGVWIVSLFGVGGVYALPRARRDPRPRRPDASLR